MKSTSSKKCKQCNCEITSITAKIFCNQSCSAKYNNTKRGLNPINQTKCKFCEKSFSFWKGSHRGLFCSNKCNGLYKTFQKFKKNTYFSQSQRKFLFEKIFKNHICSECGQGDNWNGKFLKLQIDHINGINTDNRVENLRLLCPNCHTQTETWGNPYKKQ